VTRRRADRAALALRLFGMGALLLGALAATAPTLQAADFSVSPMILEFERGVRSGEIQVRNLDQQPIRFQVRGADWSQDGSGQNVYADSRSLIWFPRALELAPGESRIIRVGVRATPATKEQAYTLFLQEVALGGAPTGKAGGAQIRLLLSISVPVFIPPVKPEPGGAIESAELRGGRLNVVVANGGNRHFSYREAAIVGLDPDGAEKFRQNVRGRTLLAGSRQRLEVRIPDDACRQLRELTLTLTTSGQSEIKRRLDVSRADCE
jgi:fimbrial chaperone protein